MVYLWFILSGKRAITTKSSTKGKIMFCCFPPLISCFHIDLLLISLLSKMVEMEKINDVSCKYSGRDLTAHCSLREGCESKGDLQGPYYTKIYILCFFNCHTTDHWHTVHWHKKRKLARFPSHQKRTIWFSKKYVMIFSSKSFKLFSVIICLTKHKYLTHVYHHTIITCT